METSVTTTEVPTSGVSDDRDVINGVRVDTRSTAKIPIPWKDNEFFESGNIDEVLLENGEVVYQCNHKIERCNYWNINGTSVKNHQRIHGGEARAKRAEQELAEARAAAEAAQAKLEEQQRRRSDAVKKAHETRRAKKNGQVTSGAVVEDAHDEPEIDVDDVDVTQIRAGLDRLALGIANITQSAELLTRHLVAIMTDLDKLKAVDPRVLEKARRFDELRGFLTE